MPTTYPGSLDSWTLPVDGNSEQDDPEFDAILAIETELGVQPSGVDATVKARLDRIDGVISSPPPLNPDTLFGPGGSVTLSGLAYTAATNVLATLQQFPYFIPASNSIADLQAALDLAETAGGGIVVFSGAVSMGTTTLNMPYPSVQLRGVGRGLSKLTYTGTGTAIQFKNFATAEMREWTAFEDFTLVATTAVIGINLKGMNRGELNRLAIEGAAVGAARTANSVGLLFDGSYGVSIGCWWNTVYKAHLHGWESCIKFTGTIGAGQANENQVRDSRMISFDTGVHIDVGDHVVIDGVGVTTTIASSTGVYVNDSDCRIRIRAEDTDTAIRVGAAAQRTQIYPSFFSNNTTCIQIDASAEDTFIHDGNAFWNTITNKYVDNGVQTRLIRTRMPGATLIPIYFAQANVTASQTDVALVPVGADAGNVLHYLGHPYQIRGVSVRANTAITAGTLTLKPTVGATESTTVSAVMTTGSTKEGWQGVGKDTNAGTSGVGVEITTDSGFLPTTMDISVIVWVELVREV